MVFTQLLTIFFIPFSFHKSFQIRESLLLPEDGVNENMIGACIFAIIWGDYRNWNENHVAGKRIHHFIWEEIF